jgi:hypothetical protein
MILLPLFFHHRVVTIDQEVTSPSVGSPRPGPSSPPPFPHVSQVARDVFHVTQEAAKAEAEMLCMQLSKVDGHVVGKTTVLRPILGFHAFFLTLFISHGSLGLI